MTAPLVQRIQPGTALEAISVSKRFGPVLALDAVDLKVESGTIHALLGENGAGKSTLMKCLMGYYRADAGQFLVAGSEHHARSPRDAGRAGIGMVYQHFTLMPSMSVAENLVLARDKLPFRIDWVRERHALEAMMATMPFQMPLGAQISSLSAGEKQKVEILKQLYLGHRLLILDEPTSVLTPQEADEVLGLLHAMTRAGVVTVVMITHKFREVLGFVVHPPHPHEQRQPAVEQREVRPGTQWQSKASRRPRWRCGEGLPPINFAPADCIRRRRRWWEDRVALRHVRAYDEEPVRVFEVLVVPRRPVRAERKLVAARRARHAQA